MPDSKATRSQNDALADKVASRVIQQITEASRPSRGAANSKRSAPEKNTGGLFKTLRKGIGFATKLVWLQTTQGPDAVSEELLDQLDTFVQKVKSSGKVKTGVVSGLFSQLEDMTVDIRTKKREYERDQHGRFASKSQQTDRQF